MKSKLIAILISIIIIFFALSFAKDVYLAQKCESRGMMWIDLMYSRKKSAEHIRDLIGGKYTNWYQEKYSSGYCISENPPANQ